MPILHPYRASSCFQPTIVRPPATPHCARPHQADFAPHKHDCRARLHRLFTREEGAVAVEFAVILPLFIGLILTAVSASLLFATLSDLQQLAHELARSSLRYAPDPGWCDALSGDWLTAYATNLPTLNFANIQSVQCDYSATTGIAEVSVTYDASNSVGSILGRLVGLDLGTISRQSFVRL